MNGPCSDGDWCHPGPKNPSPSICSSTPVPRGSRPSLPWPCTPPSLHRPGQRVLYEWGRQDTGKQPYFVRPTGDEVFALAGIWDQWEGKQGEVIESVAIITTSANELMQPIHDRMPVILGKGNVAEWIEPQTVIDKALAMLKPFPSEMMVAR
ncbi:MAG: SOS response-associated peptidase [Proteobacteria bacterium]|nr:SOS response-associated peptidase [Pseudomonadota bacterium]